MPVKPLLHAHDWLSWHNYPRHTMKDYLKEAEHNRLMALELMEKLDITGAWESAGAEVNIVGSLKTGLIMKHLDMDFHVYTSRLDVSAAFAAMGRIASAPAVRRVEYTDLSDTEEKCLEWHLWCDDREGRLWQVDIMNILKGSTYDGYFERMAERISAVLTPQSRDAILRIKYELPDGSDVHGTEIYQAVIRDGVRDYASFENWRRAHRSEGIIHWIP